MPMKAVEEERETDEAIPIEPKSLLCQLMERVGSIPKDGKNDFHNYRYISASAVLNKVREAIVDLNIESVPHYQIVGSERVMKGDQDKGVLVTVRCELGVRHQGVTLATSIAYGSGMDTGDKAVMKAMTAAHKYCWMHLLNISTGDDPEDDTRTDANAAEAIPAPKPIKMGEGPQVAMVKVISTPSIKTTRTGGSRYTIHTNKGDFHTFSKDVATAAEVARSTDAEMRIPYVETKYGRDIVAEK